MNGPIRITDLGAPVLNDIQRIALDYGERHPVELTDRAVLDAARATTGLDSFGPDTGGPDTGGPDTGGPDDFRHRMNLWLRDVDDDANRTGLGRRMVFDYAVRYAANRQRIFDLLGRHPEIHDVAIAAPVVVVGLPRSGTTHLVNLLAADTRLQSLPLWESYEPVAVAGEEPDQRRDRAQVAWEQMLLVAPYTAAMHPMDPDHVHEEIELQGADFAHYQPEWVSYAPGYRAWYQTTDQTPHYAFLRLVLQVVQWQRARRGDPAADRRWVLKSPQHLEQLGPLLTAFPDATIVMTHRDPVSVVQSAATMMAYAARLQYHQVDLVHHLNYWTERIRGLLAASIRDSEFVAGRHVDVYFDDFMADDVATAHCVLSAAGLTPNAEAARAVEQRAAGRRRGAHGQVVYDLRADFDVEPTSIRAEFAEYLDAFPRIAVEVR